MPAARQRLLLVGGGHSHAIVLDRFIRAPLADIEVTVVCRDALTPYSGMLPGFVAGHYEHDAIHIDLPALCARAGAAFVHGEVDGLDPAGPEVRLTDGRTLDANVISIDIGSAPDMTGVEVRSDAVTPVKPISSFVPRWRALAARVASGESPRIGVVGGGAGGTEMILAMHHALTQGNGSRPEKAPGFSLITGGTGPLAGFPRPVRTYFVRRMEERGIEIRSSSRVTALRGNEATLDSGEQLAFDELLWVTNAGVQPWLASAGLAVDERGFARVATTLQSTSHPRIFATGDCATVEGHPREKAGVFAVRQGPPLADNLRRALAGETLQPFIPQRRFLSLISTGDRNALATRKGRLWAAGRWVWHWKDRIDRGFMARFEA